MLRSAAFQVEALRLEERAGGRAPEQPHRGGLVPHALGMALCWLRLAVSAGTIAG